MSGEYQLRKDIDEIQQRLNNIGAELSNIGVISKDDDIESILGTILSTIDELDDFNVSLTTLGSSLNRLDEQLNGDGTTDGLVDYIDVLEFYMYGKGGKDEYDVPYTYNYPSPLSLKGVLITLENELSQIISGDQQLSIDLATLGEYLTGFSGTLAEFKEELESHGIDLTNVNEGLINLIYHVNYTKDEVDDHKDKLEEFDDMIGTPSDTGNSTMYGVLNNTVSGLDNVSTSTTNLTKTLYSGTNGTGTTSSPANNTVMKNLNTATSNVTSLTSKVGTVNVATDGSLATQVHNVDVKVGTASDSYSDGDNTVYGKLNDNIDYTYDLDGQISEQESNISQISDNLNKYHLPSFSLDWTYLFVEAINMSEVYELEENYKITINYAYKTSNKQWYERYSESSFITTQNPPSSPIGVCSTLPDQSLVSGSSLSFYTYELASMNYFKYESNNWSEQTDLSDFFAQTNMYNNINDDFATQSDFDVLDGQINDTDGIADTVTGLGNTVSGLDSQINDTNGIADTVTEHTNDISDLDESVGSVDVEVNSDLQTQIMNIIDLMRDLLIMVGKPSNLEEVTSEIHYVTIDDVTTTYYEVAEDYPYEFIQTLDSNEYYKKTNAIVDNQSMIIWEWCLNPFTDKFKQTTLYDILTYFFTERATPFGQASDYNVKSTDLDTANISEATIYFYRQFNIVTVNYFFQTVDGLYPSEHTLIQTGKIPSDFRPSTAFTQTISDYGSSTIKNAYLKINPDGSMKFKIGVIGSIGTYGTLRYIVED